MQSTRQPIGITRALLAAVLMIGCVLFIWGNSFLDGEASGRISEAVAVFLSKVLGAIFGKSSNLVLFVRMNMRKIAHALEFFVLGFTSMVFLVLLRRVNAHMVAHAFLLVLAVAVADEAIQGFVAYRGSQVQDILLDFGGGMAGILSTLGLWAFCIGLFRRRKD